VDRLKAALKHRALELGFDLVGIAAAGSAATARHLERWLAAGMHAQMGYMARTADLRTDPRRLLPECRSVVAVAMSYHTDRPLSLSPQPDGESRVWISRYAWGRDYHKVLKKRLIRLGRWLEAEARSARWRTTVDTAPILEREWSARAGLGWIGKNSLLLNRSLGSELFLGLLLTDVAMEPDHEVPEHCGRCTACLEACPTAALVAPRTLDSRRCLGYLTVEHRGDIPEELQSAMGTMVAGCDICQEVCPWTLGAPADLHAEFQPACHRFRPRLQDLETLDEAGWRAWRSGSPLTRIPFRQLRRSLAVARSNLMGGAISSPRG
jgi:epoxyqueuosine reductase